MTSADSIIVSTRRERLFSRQMVLSSLRTYFLSAGFLEAEVPLLLPSTCPDAGIDSISVGNEYLTTSTEYQIKRLIAGGLPRVFTLTKNFRRGDISQHHNPEFTMLEWGRAEASLSEIEADVEQFVRAALRALGLSESAITYGEHALDLTPPYRRQTVRDALEEHLGLRFDKWTLKAIQQGLSQSSIDVPSNFQTNISDLVSYITAELQPHLGWGHPLFLTDWPAFQTSSAALTSEDTAERSELFMAGLEIADGFPFLTDPLLQRAQFDAQQKRRRDLNKEPVVVDAAYLAALDAGLPAGAGMALGIDRLVMILTNAASIREVMPFAWDER